MQNKQEDQLLQYYTLVEDMRSSLGATVIDADDEVESMTQTLTGLAETDSITLRRLAMVTEIPLPYLIGENVKGLNSTGDTEEKIFQGMRSNMQSSYYLEPLNLLMARLGLGCVWFKGSTFETPDKQVEFEGRVLENATRMMELGEDYGKYLEEKGVVERDSWDEFWNKDNSDNNESDGMTPEESRAMFEEFMDKGVDFDENKHPRDKDGQFAKGQGGKSNPNEKKAQPKKKIDYEKSRSDHDKKQFKLAESMGIKIPPAWKDIWINQEKDAKVLVKGRDAKGRTQSIYSSKAVEERDLKKFKRLKKFSAMHKDIMSRIDNDLEKSDEAKVLKLINETGFRVGGDKDTGAEKQAYGASTLLWEHVKISGDTVEFNFTGKKGVSQSHIVKNKEIANLFGERGEDGERVFNTNASNVLKYLKGISDSDIKTKDFRTYVATSTGLKAMKNMKPPKTEKERQSAIMKVAEIVSKKLGNTPKMAKDSYIDPTIFKKWEV